MKYLAETTGKDINTVVNWFLLMIIFVFDPLAIALVVAANFAFSRVISKDPVKMSVPEGMEFKNLMQYHLLGLQRLKRKI